MSLKVIGTGMGRTGTHSLKIALEQLGFGKCYHMFELFKQPENLVYFKKAERGEKVDWEALFTNYSSAVDYPIIRYHKRIMEKYPEAKIIHTIRDPEAWYQSATETIFWASKPSLGRMLKLMTRMPFSPPLRKRFPVLVFDGKLLTWEFGKDLKNKQAVIQKYNEYNDSVIKTIPKDNLLVYNLKEGWEPLCNFLNVPVPSMPFPRSNTREDFMKSVKAIATGKKL